MLNGSHNESFEAFNLPQRISSLSFSPLLRIVCQIKPKPGLRIFPHLWFNTMSDEQLTHHRRVRIEGWEAAVAGLLSNKSRTSQEAQISWNCQQGVILRRSVRLSSAAPSASSSSSWTQMRFSADCIIMLWQMFSTRLSFTEAHNWRVSFHSMLIKILLRHSQAPHPLPCPVIKETQKRKISSISSGTELIRINVIARGKASESELGWEFVVQTESLIGFQEIIFNTADKHKVSRCMLRMSC